LGVPFQVALSAVAFFKSSNKASIANAMACYHFNL
jgi:hypothetical protein